MKLKILGPGYCTDRCCVDCNSRKLSVLIKETKQSWPPPEFDWAELEQASDLARQHRYPSGETWKRK